VGSLVRYVVGARTLDAASKLIRWVTRGSVRQSADDLEMLRLFLITLLPQLSGLVLMVARR
jgi:hypothetical protein